MSEEKHRVVIIGAGFGGLFAARALRRAPVDVTVVDRTNHHLFQPLLYQVATGVLSEGDIAPPTRDVLRHCRNTKVLIGEVVHIDLGTREVVLETIGRRTRVPLRQPDRRRRCDAIVFRSRRVRSGCTRHEDDR